MMEESTTTSNNSVKKVRSSEMSESRKEISRSSSRSALESSSALAGLGAKREALKDRARASLDEMGFGDSILKSKIDMDSMLQGSLTKSKATDDIFSDLDKEIAATRKDLSDIGSYAAAPISTGTSLGKNSASSKSSSYSYSSESSSSASSQKKLGF